MLEVPGYRIEGEAGRGGWSVVYRAVQLASNRPVALKVMTPELAGDPSYRARFRRERELAASLDHPHVQPVYEHGEADGRPWVALRWVDGAPLSELAPLDAPRGARIAAQVGAALDTLHARGRVHRDVKPGNVLVEQRPEGDHAYLADFGLAKEISPDPGLTHDGRWLGTADFAAPEQIRGQPTDARSDVYSLGCLLGFALTGSVPYPRATPEETMQAHLHEPVPRIGGPLDAVIGRALAKNPDWRFQTAGELGRAALAVIDPAPRRRPSRRVIAAVAAGLVLLAGAVTLGLVLTGGDDGGEGEVAQLPITQEPPLARRGTAVVLAPEDGGGGTGKAYFDKQGRNWTIEVDAQLERTKSGYVYEVWLYNSRRDAWLLDTSKTDRNGRLRVSTSLEDVYVRDFSYIDVSLEPNTEGSEIHSGNSVLRGRRPAR